MPDEPCGCWRNSETGYLEACQEHEAEIMDRMMELEKERNGDENEATEALKKIAVLHADNSIKQDRIDRALKLIRDYWLDDDFDSNRILEDVQKVLEFKKDPDVCQC